MSYQLRPTQPSSQDESGYDGHNMYEYGYGNSYGQQQQQPAYPQPHQQPEIMHAQPRPQPQSPSHLPMPPPISETTMYYHDGLARTQTWIANQPPVMTPPPTTRTPFSEWTGPTDSSFDRRTLGGYSATMPPRPPKEDIRVCGIKRAAFYVVLAVGFFLLVAAIAVGLGVGLGTRKSGGSVAGDATAADLGAISSSLSSSSPSTTNTPTLTASTTATSIIVSPTPSFTGILIPGPVICPQDNNTVYVSQGTSKPFNVQCGFDYNSANGARDITHMHKPTMAQCIDACGERAGCVGVGWGNYQGTYQCWMKSKLGDPNPSSQWYFAQLQDMEVDSE
ncbi:hypothetical protein GGR53DRAFT_315475 [Hypoxylon sp. FL1150]|nr:hypothetical protein GGR53DRAFT_315475 [Hypoxylon sp. FL1150]